MYKYIQNACLSDIRSGCSFCQSSDVTDETKKIFVMNYI